MTQRDWIIKRLQENNFDAKIVSNMYDLCQAESLTTGKKSTFKRKVRDVVAAYKAGKNLAESKTEEVSPVSTKVSEEMKDSLYSALVTSVDIKTQEDLIEYLKIDTNIWELDTFTRNTWGSANSPCFQLKGVFKKKKSEFNEALVLESIKQSVCEFKPVQSEIKTQNHKSGNMLEIAIKDHHYGQLSNASETGEDYNLEIARKLYLESIQYMLANTTSYKIEKIVLTVGSDFFNTDTPNSTTYAGTYQAEADRWKKVFTTGTELIIQAVEFCKQYCNSVKIVVIQGNHDYTRSFYLGIALQQRYCNDNSVIIDCSESPRKYEVWGKNLICFTHGDKEVKGKLPLIVSQEQRVAFSNCKFIEIHSGHLHIEKESLIMCNEDVAIKFRILPSLVAIDDWHNEKGYKHIRESQGYVWNKEHGNIAVFKYHV